MGNPQVVSLYLQEGSFNMCLRLTDAVAVKGNEYQLRQIVRNYICPWVILSDLIFPPNYRSRSVLRG